MKFYITYDNIEARVKYHKFFIFANVIALIQAYVFGLDSYVDVEEAGKVYTLKYYPGRLMKGTNE